MKRQILLPLDREDQERRRLWSQLPEQDRSNLATLYAKLIAQAARITTSPQPQEPGHETRDR